MRLGQEKKNKTLAMAGEQGGNQLRSADGLVEMEMALLEDDIGGDLRTRIRRDSFFSGVRLFRGSSSS